MNMDWVLIWTVVGTGAGIVGLISSILRNFKTDINSHIDAVNIRIDKIDRDWREESRRIDQAWKEESRKMDQRILEANKRMDGVYHLLLTKFGSPRTDP